MTVDLTVGEPSLEERVGHSYRYDAFISYSRKDQAFARKFEKALENYNPPKDLAAPQRHLEVFRDEADYTGVEYDTGIKKHLEDSATLLVLCSPSARLSIYVAQEIRIFAETHPIDNIIPVLISGLPNNEAVSSDQQSQMAFPDALFELMRMPLAADYRGFDLKHDAFAKGSFENAWYTTLANIYGLSRRDIEQRDKRRQARARRITSLIVTAIIASLSLAATVALVQRQIAVRERNVAISRELATAALSQIPFDPELSGLLAVEAAHTTPTEESDDALRAFLREPYVRAEFRDQAREASGHPAGINAVAFSRDGRFMASAGDDGPARVWDTATRTRVSAVTASNSMEAVAFSPDATRIATGSLDGLATISETTSGRPLAVLTGHTASINDICFSDDGRFVATASQDKTARVWDATDGHLIAEMRGHGSNARSRATNAGDIRTVKFSPDGTLVLTASSDATAMLWDARTGRAVHVLGGHREALNSAAFSPDGQLVVTASDDATARVWRTKTGTVQSELSGHTDRISSAAFSPHGLTIVTSSWDQTARIWDAATGRAVGILRGHNRVLLNAAFSPDGKYVVTAGVDNAVRVWAAATWTQIALIHARGHLYRATVTPDSKSVVTIEGSVVRAWESAAWKAASELHGHTKSILDAQFSVDGRHVITGSADGTARIWDLPAGRTLHVLPTHTLGAFTARFSPNGALAVTADGETAIVWDAVTGKRVAELQLEGQDIAGASFSPDGQFIVTIPALSRAAHLWRTDSWQLLKQLGTHDDWFEAAVFSPDGSRVATGSYDGISRIWDVSTGKVLKEFSEHHSQVRGVAFDPSGSTIATASYDTMARISDVATGAVITEISEQQPLHSISFSPDGRFVVSTSNIVRIWEPGTGNTILELGGFGNDVLSATFSPNGRLIVVGDGPTAGVYQCIVCAQRNELPALATARLSRSLTGEERKKFLHER